jgi:thiamine-phosphate pyrophosphorylase
LPLSANSTLRIIDENLDRLAEGLRVLEDTARMLLDDAGLTSRLKTIRHDLVRRSLDFNLALLDSRDSVGDVGEMAVAEGENPARELPLIVLANARRVQEALRVLEELAKLPEFQPNLDSAAYKAARFKLYTIEKELVDRLVRKDKAGRLKGLYVIVDTQYLGERSPLKAAAELLEAGVRIVQLRAKNLAKKQVLDMVLEMQSICRRSGALFIINDYLDIALAVKADGLHIGQEDLPAATARRLLPPGMLLGVSAAEVDEARRAEADGADYLGVGAIYPTVTKTKIGSVGPDRIAQIRAATRLPVAAIGGITSKNIEDVMRAGADSACVISAVLGAPDIQTAAKELIERIEAVK